MADRTLATMLEEIDKLKTRKDEVQTELSSIKRKLSEVEDVAGELLLASGMTKVTSVGRTWWTSEQLLVSIPRDQREAVLEAAEKEGLRDELTTVNTSTLKAWLVERANETGQDLDNAAEGTAFDGLISKFVTRKLHSVRASKG